MKYIKFCKILETYSFQTPHFSKRNFKCFKVKLNTPKPILTMNFLLYDSFERFTSAEFDVIKNSNLLGCLLLRLRHTHEPEPDNAGVGKRKLRKITFIFLLFSPSYSLKLLYYFLEGK